MAISGKMSIINSTKVHFCGSKVLERRGTNMGKITEAMFPYN
jgi:hypothetical protein